MPMMPPHVPHVPTQEREVKDGEGRTLDMLAQHKALQLQSNTDRRRLNECTRDRDSVSASEV